MKRLRKILKWAGIVLGVAVLVVLALNAWLVWVTDARLEAQLAAIRRSGDPLSFAELAPKPVPPEQNAATYLHRAEADVAAIDKGTFDESGNPYPWARHWHSRISAEDRKVIRALWDAHPNLLPLLEQAAACPDCDWQLDYKVGPIGFSSQLSDTLSRLRHLARVLCLRAMLLRAEGSNDEAVRTSVLLLRLCRILERAPTAANWMTVVGRRATAIECVNMVFQTGPVSQEVRDALDGELDGQGRANTCIGTFKGERAWGLDAYAILRCNFWLIARPYWNWRESKYLDEFQEFLALATRPIPFSQAKSGVRDDTHFFVDPYW